MTVILTAQVDRELCQPLQISCPEDRGMNQSIQSFTRNRTIKFTTLHHAAQTMPSSQSLPPNTNDQSGVFYDITGDAAEVGGRFDHVSLVDPGDQSFSGKD